jgi:hypothetical protein
MTGGTGRVLALLAIARCARISGMRNARFFGTDNRECPSFLPHFVQTLEDVHFMRDCGINPEISRIEAVSSVVFACDMRKEQICTRPFYRSRALGFAGISYGVTSLDPRLPNRQAANAKIEARFFSWSITPVSRSTEVKLKILYVTCND